MDHQKSAEAIVGGLTRHCVFVEAAGRSRASCPTRHLHIPVQWPLSGVLPYAAPAHPCAMESLPR